MLWQEKTTQVSVQDTYDNKVWPTTNIFNDGPITFAIPPQPNGMLHRIEVVTKFKVNIPGPDHPKTNLSIINNVASAMWETVEVKLDDRLDLMQSMRNSYAYQTYFNKCFNTSSIHEDYLFARELFQMDDAVDKTDAEDVNMLNLRGLTAAELSADLHTSTPWTFENMGPSIRQSAHKILLGEEETDHKVVEYIGKNQGALSRGLRINNGQSVTTNTLLQCPLFTTGKCLPTNMRIRVLLSKNSDKFLLLAEDSTNCKVVIEDVYLNVTYYRPRDTVLQSIEEQLKKEPAPYFVSKNEIILRPITSNSRIIRVNDVFPGNLPSHAFFCLQKSIDFEGKFSTNPFVFVPFGKFQIHVNGVPHFVDPLEIDFEIIDKKKIYRENGTYLHELYSTIGRDLKGDCLINSSNFQLNFIAAASFTADRSTTMVNYLNLQETASTYVEIDMGYDTDLPDDLVLIVYALYDRQIQIDANRSVRIIE